MTLQGPWLIVSPNMTMGYRAVADGVSLRRVETCSIYWLASFLLCFVFVKKLHRLYQYIAVVKTCSESENLFQLVVYNNTNGLTIIIKICTLSDKVWCSIYQRFSRGLLTITKEGAITLIILWILFSFVFLRIYQISLLFSVYSLLYAGVLF